MTRSAFGGGLVLAGMVLATSACSSLGYYTHVARGQAALLLQRKAVADVIADPHTDAKLRARLAQTQAARAFASDHLQLPRNRSYTSYVDLNRPYVTWNVFAVPEFAVEPVTHCFPFAGCVAYQGYFERVRAEREAARLSASGNDTQIEGAVAYSTLGWFADPILSSMLRWSDDELDSTIFHELAHQKLYVKDDTAFNESYASFVAEQGFARMARGAWTGAAVRPGACARRRIHSARTRSARTLAPSLCAPIVERGETRGQDAGNRRVSCSLCALARQRLERRPPL